MFDAGNIILCVILCFIKLFLLIWKKKNSVHFLGANVAVGLALGRSCRIDVLDEKVL